MKKFRIYEFGAVCGSFFIFFYKIEFLLYPNLSVYVCEAPSWRLESRPLPLQEFWFFATEYLYL